MDIEIVGMNHNGDGIGKIDGKVIFVPKSIIGDIVRVKNIVSYKNYSVGEIDSFVRYSDKRVDTKCPYYDRCGGCQIMELGYDEQLKYKKNMVIDIFKKYGNRDINPLIEGSNNYSYRNKVIFQVKGGKIGFFELDSNNFIEVDKCLLINDKMNRVISIIRDNTCLDNISKIMIRDSLDGVMIVFFGKVNDIDVDVFGDMVNSIYVNDKKIYGDEFIISLDKYRFVVSPDSFFQVNLDGMLKLYSYVRDSINMNNVRLLDLYCGVGSIGIFCADRCKEVVGVEINNSAIENANKNKIINGIGNISFKCVNANKINYNEGEFDVVIVDPPRGGLDKKTIDIIMNIKSKEVIYVSCNPITLVRDINRLSLEYDICNIKLFDMFPNTYHVESIAVLRRNDF